MEAVKLAEKLWDLANLVTGFGVVQSLTVTYAMAKGDWRVSGVREHWIGYIGTAVFTAGYIVAIVLCGGVGQSFDSSTNAQVWRAATWGRVVAVLAFALVTLLAFCGHRRDEVAGRLRVG